MDGVAVESVPISNTWNDEQHKHTKNASQKHNSNLQLYQVIRVPFIKVPIINESFIRIPLIKESFIGVSYKIAPFTMARLIIL